MSEGIPVNDDSELNRVRMVERMLLGPPYGAWERWCSKGDGKAAERVEAYDATLKAIAEIVTSQAAEIGALRSRCEAAEAAQADVRVVFDQNNAYYEEIQRLRVRAGIADDLVRKLAERGYVSTSGCWIPQGDGYEGEPVELTTAEIALLGGAASGADKP